MALKCTFALEIREGDPLLYLHFDDFDFQRFVRLSARCLIRCCDSHLHIVKIGGFHTH